MDLNMDEVQDVYCRDSWQTHLPYLNYSMFTCVKCFVQVFFNAKPLKMNFDNPYLLYHKENSSISYTPDAESDQSTVCRDWLTNEECSRWRSCCQSARKCCLDVQNVKSPSAGRLEGSCDATWDGVSCWPSTEAGVLASHNCPSHYIADKISWLNPQTSRNCTENGSWSIHPRLGWEMSNYEDCFNTQTNIEVLKSSLYIDFIGNGLSILFLLAAITLILGSRPLRLELAKKTGLRLHFNLFVAVLLKGAFTVAFHIVYFDAFTSAGNKDVVPVYYNNAVWCRVLHALTKYFKSATYMAMFCEGLFLYKRISNVMRMGVRDSMMKYIVITWGVPVVMVVVYSIVRVLLQRNDRCWIDQGISFIEFIIIIPNILSLACNLIFVVSIELMLCTKMRSDTSDTRVAVLRQALRATLSLIPIFGLQFLFIIYRPQDWPPYEIIIAFFTSTQGILVATLYCFATKEVRREIDSVCHKCREQQKDSLRPVNPRRSTMYSALSSAGNLFSNIGQRMSKQYGEAKRSLPDLLNSSGRRTSHGARTSLSRCSMETAQSALLSPRRSPAPSEDDGDSLRASPSSSSHSLRSQTKPPNNTDNDWTTTLKVEPRKVSPPVCLKMEDMGRSKKPRVDFAPTVIIAQAEEETFLTRNNNSPACSTPASPVPSVSESAST